MYDSALLSALKNADNFILCAHINPDGDAIGSMLALGRLLRRLGKRVTMVCPGAVPRRLAWLPDAELIRPLEQVKDNSFDTAFSVDVPETKRMGDVYALYERAQLTFAVDHHPGDASFAQYRLVDAQASASGELIVALYEALDMPLDPEAATQLYVAISTDTGNFVFSSVRSYTFACMEKLLEAGLDLNAAARRMFLIKSRPSAAMLGCALTSMKYFAGGRATCMHITARQKAACGAEDDDLHGMVNSGLNLEGVSMTFMADEAEANVWKISLRALPGGDVASVARRFGGGGHVLAAGCVITGEYAEVEARLIAEIEKALNA